MGSQVAGTCTWTLTNGTWVQTDNCNSGYSCPSTKQARAFNNSVSEDRQKLSDLIAHGDDPHTPADLSSMAEGSKVWTSCV
jgi:hypothetical protein